MSRPRIVLVSKASVGVSLSPLFFMDSLDHGTPCDTSNGFHKVIVFFLGGSFDIAAEVEVKIFTIYHVQLGGSSMDMTHLQQVPDSRLVFTGIHADHND